MSNRRNQKIKHSQQVKIMLFAQCMRHYAIIGYSALKNHFELIYNARGRGKLKTINSKTLINNYFEPLEMSGEAISPGCFGEATKPNFI